MLAWRWTGGGTVCWLCGFCALGGFDGVDGDCWAGVCADGVCGDGVCGVGVVPDVGGALGGVFRPGVPLGFAGVGVLELAPELEAVPLLGVGVVLGVEAEAGAAAGELLGLVLGLGVGVVTGVVARFGVLDVLDVLGVLGVVLPLGFAPVTGVLAGVGVRVGVEEDDGEGVLGFALGLMPGVELGVVCGVVLPVGVPVPAVGFGLVVVAALVVVVGVAAGEVSRCGVLVPGLGLGLGPALGLVPGVVVCVALGIVLRLGVPVPVPVLGPVTGLLAGTEVRGGVEGDDDGDGVPAADTFGLLTGEPPAGVAVGVLGPVVGGREEEAGPALSRLGPEGMPEAGDAAAWLVVPGSGLWWLGV
jgi:hypothetical protein